jgi:hypothetical protein
VAGCWGAHLRLPLHADGIEAVLCHWLQQATVPQLPLELHPQRELPGGAPPTGTPVRPAPVHRTPGVKTTVLRRGSDANHTQQQDSVVSSWCMEGPYGNAPANAVAWVGGVIIGVQPQ